MIGRGLVFGVALLSAAALTGCQPVARPFAHQDGLDRAILQIPDRAGVFVEATEPAGLAPALVSALHAADLIAMHGGGKSKASFGLRGQIGEREITWSLTGPDGQAIGRATEPYAPGDLAGLDTDGKNSTAELDAHLARVADAVVELVTDDEVERTGPGPSRLPVHVAPVQGAPGSGNIELTQAMRATLAAIPEITLTDDELDALVIRGAVDISLVQDGTQSVAIRWIVYDRDGTEIGSIDQGNQVPAGSLDGRWGVAARQISLAASVGLGELLSKVRIVAAE